MNTVVIKVRRGADSKLYLAHPLTEAERKLARGLAHAAVCHDGLSIWAAQRRMRDEHGVSRSVGQIWNDLHHLDCGYCREQE